MIVDPEPLHVAVELPMVVLHLAAEIVDHVVDMLRVAVFFFKELGHVLNIISVQSLSSNTGEAHGDDVCENVSEIQVVSINLESSLVFTNSLSDSFYQSSVFKVHPEQSDESEYSDKSDDDEQFAESFPVVILLAEFVKFVLLVDVVNDHTDSDGGPEGKDHHNKVDDVVPGLLTEENPGSEGNNSEEHFNNKID